MIGTEICSPEKGSKLQFVKLKVGSKLCVSFRAINSDYILVQKADCNFSVVGYHS